TGPTGADSTVTGPTGPTGPDSMTGWISVSDSWSYASTTTITVPSGAGSLYEKGDKIKFTNNSATKYFYVILVSDELLTVTGGNEYSVENSAISNILISHCESPTAFPDFFDWTPSHTGFSADPTVKARFKISGKMCHVYYCCTAGGTSNATTYYITLPVKPKSHTGTVNWVYPLQCVDSGSFITTQWGKVRIKDNDINGYFYTTPGTGTWTASGAKYADFDGWYEI
ncbi:TPA: hypothetical protein DEP90_00440, partial [Patescibacteria group bacterium]|nr:hypothetical protein [Patescibacteria group bacterium]